MNNAKLVASEFITFLNKAVSPYHAVEECSILLKTAGFTELKETEIWHLQPQAKYYLTRNKSTIIAFAVGGKFKPGNGIAMVAAHTDSPCLRVKPVSKLSSADCLQIGVMPYGGGLWRTWFDRDLTLAGRVLIQGEDNVIRQKLVHIEKPIMSIPNLAIHLDRDSNEKFVFNKEDHLRPILATQVADCLKVEEKADKPASADECSDHHPMLLKRLAEQLNIEPKKILNFDLCVIDTQPAVIGGLNDEFIYGGRLDNLVSTYGSIMALIDSCKTDQNLANDPCVRLVACYDNEECGSESAQGAASALTEWVLRRLQNATAYERRRQQPDCEGGAGAAEPADCCAFERGVARSMLVSADQAHAQHPNYKAKHDDCHAPRFHRGVVVKINPNQRYATTSFTHAFLGRVAAAADVPLQKFVVRNDSLCGSTVGPILSAKLGLKTIDIGTPQLAMHSIREMSCISGVYHIKKLLTKYFERYDEISQQFEEAC